MSVPTDKEEPTSVHSRQVIGFFNYINRIAESLGVDLEPEMPPRD